VDYPFKTTQADIFVHFSQEWGVTFGHSTVKDKVKWLVVMKDSSGILLAKSPEHEFFIHVVLWYQGT